MDSNRTISVLFTTDIENAANGERLEFPATKEEMREMLEYIGKSNAGWWMVPTLRENGLTSPIGALTSLKLNDTNVNELNYLAVKLSKLESNDLEKFEAVVESGRYLASDGVGNDELSEYINIADNLDCFTFHSGMDESGYGETLLSGPDNPVSRLIRQLQNSSSEKDQELANIVECLRENVDAEQFGRSMSYNNDGDFLDGGYLIEEGGFNAEYYGLPDIPAEYRIWEPPETFIKVVDVDLRGLLMEMHTLGGNYTQDAADNLQTLMGGDEFFITENSGKLTVLPAAEVFRTNSPKYMSFQVAYEADARAFFAALNESSGSELWGGLHEIDINEIKNEVARLSYGAAGIDAEFKDGTNRLFTPAEWSELSNWDREQAAGMVYRYDPADESRASEFISDLCDNAANNGRMITQEDFLALLNAPFMAKAQNRQPDMLRIARETARDMLARSDAEIYRLMPEGAVKLSPLDAVKSGGLWFKEHREFAIKLGGLAGLRKWANRTADEIARQAMRGEHKKYRETEH